MEFYFGCRAGMFMLRVVALVLFLCANHAMAEDVTGGQLLKRCKSVVKSLDDDRIDTSVPELHQGQCLGLIEGVRFTMIMLDDKIKAQYPMCWPEVINNDMSVRTVVSYLEAHPEKLWVDQTVAVMMAYIETYSCD